MTYSDCHPQGLWDMNGCCRCHVRKKHSHWPLDLINVSNVPFGDPYHFLDLKHFIYFVFHSYEVDPALVRPYSLLPRLTTCPVTLAAIWFGQEIHRVDR